MASGTPLDDARRGVWIERVRAALEERADVVVACSALRRVHRLLLQGVDGVRLYFLDVPVDELSRRLLARPAHFFPPELLPSQLDTLDPPQPDEGIVVIDAHRPIDEVVDDIVEAVTRA
jgi:gluconokinase